MEPTRIMVLWAALILLPAAFFFSVVADLPHVFVITVILLIFSALRKQGWRITDRTVIYFTVLAMAITMFGNYMVPLKQDHRFGFMAIFSRPALSVPFVLYLGALAAGFRKRGHVIGICAAAAVLSFGLGGDIRYETLTGGDRNGAVNPFLASFQLFYGVSMTLSVLAILFGSRSGGKRGNWRRNAILAIGLVLMGGLMIVEFWGYRRYENTFRNLENRLLRLGIRQLYRPHQSMMNFSSSPNLQYRLPPEFLEMSDRVALRVVGKNAPGYMRSRSFVRYERGTWNNAEESIGTPLSATMAEGSMSAEQLYAYTRMEKTPFFCNVFPDDSLLTTILPLQGNTISLALIATRVVKFKDGRVEADGFMRDGGYTIYAAAPQAEAVYPLPTKPGNDLLDVPEDIEYTLAEIVSDLDLASLASDQERMDALDRYFAENFSYGLDWPGARAERNTFIRRNRPRSGNMTSRYTSGMAMNAAGRLSRHTLSSRRGGRFNEEFRHADPIRFFLTEHKRAHCELYASAAVMLLRQAGIPARYVTGLICNERHPSGRYFIARYGNAHAWVEAFDSDRQEWVLFDPTPPAVTEPSMRPDTWAERLRSQADLLRLSWIEILSNLRRGHFADSVVGIGTLIWEGILYALLHPVWGPLIGLILAGVVWVVFRRRKRRSKDFLTPEKRRIQKEYRRLVQRLKRRKYLEKEEFPTAAELLARIECDDTLLPPQRIELVNYLADYLVRRYSVQE